RSPWLWPEGRLPYIPRSISLPAMLRHSLPGWQGLRSPPRRPVDAAVGPTRVIDGVVLGGQEESQSPASLAKLIAGCWVGDMSEALSRLPAGVVPPGGRGPFFAYEVAVREGSARAGQAGPHRGPSRLRMPRRQRDDRTATRRVQRAYDEIGLPAEPGVDCALHP